MRDCARNGRTAARATRCCFRGVGAGVCVRVPYDDKPALDGSKARAFH
jgi:hypothetical protein